MLALSATPGSEKKKIQDVVRNLLISHIEVRSEDDLDVLPFTNQKSVDIIRCGSSGNGSNRGSGGMTDTKQLMINLLKPGVELCDRYQIMSCANPQYLNAFVLDEAATYGTFQSEIVVFEHVLFRVSEPFATRLPMDTLTPIFNSNSHRLLVS